MSKHLSRSRKPLVSLILTNWLTNSLKVYIYIYIYIANTSLILLLLFIVEDQNFALFNYVNEMNGEIEMIQEAIQQIKSDIEQFKSQGVEMEEKRKAILKGLEQDLATVTDKTGSYSAKFAAATKVLEQLMSGNIVFTQRHFIRTSWIDTVEFGIC